MESLRGAWRPGVPRPLTPDDEFFDEGNEFCFPAASRADSRKYTCIFEDEDESGHQQEKSSHETIGSDEGVTCLEPGCGVIFKSLLLYEVHYALLHRYVCSECRVHLPTSRLLDLHVDERHSVMRGTNYHCILADCQESFLTPDERKSHVIEAHGYPASFRYFIYLGSKQVNAKSVRKKTMNRTSSTPETECNTNNSNNDIDDVHMSTVEACPVGADRRVPAKICFGYRSRR